MADSYWLILGSYLLVSISGLIFCKWVATRLSGLTASTPWFWLSIALTVAWGMVQLNVAKYGGVIFFEGTKKYLEENELVRLCALIITLLLTGCTPRPEKKRPGC
ncbi:hypothetical protein PMM47T1_18590 [Pseudomonas sp. M47T1]|uniref:hypothetical protein n=1 Tax=Pseudomonas sp. M47T1 TaxID=1179778 RepID=UPI000260682B|nr:hypothetical protein [Pseudomonas sp. M47T1]EIK94989.1 hypothetical protein PMM47T1_18590 [Pseudomonas sp. M47T1]